MKSHNALFQKYVDALHARGHELTVVSPFRLQNNSQNYRHINTEKIIPNTSDSVMINSSALTRSIHEQMSFFSKFESTHCRVILAHPDLRKLYTSKEKLFDLVIVESYYVHCYLPLGAVDNTPVVWFLAPSRMFAADLAIGNVQNPSTFPMLLRKYEFPLSRSASFTSRLQNLKNYILMYLYHYFYFDPLTRSICEEYFHNEKISCEVNDLFKSVSLVLSYSHRVLHPRATVPNHVGIGGLHVEPAKPLPYVS